MKQGYRLGPGGGIEMIMSRVEVGIMGGGAEHEEVGVGLEVLSGLTLDLDMGLG